MAHSLVIILLFPSHMYAYTTLESNYSIPINSTNFVSSNSTRGTIDILWSCLFTIITCTWTVQHLNVPEQREGRNPGKWGIIWWAIKRGWTRVKWMLVTVLAPEILLAKNVGDLAAVTLNLEELQDWAAQDGVPWTRTHSLFANMGGFVIRRNSPERAVTATFPETRTDQQKPIPRARKTAGWKAKIRSRMGWKSKTNIELGTFGPPEQNLTERNELLSAELDLSANETSQPALIYLLTQDIVLLRSEGLLPKLPYITLEEIRDKSKSDGLVRAITVIQITWTIIQVIARAFRSLAISQLEISVVAFATCAIILYGLNWEKPKGVQVPITIISYPGSFPEDTLKIVKKDEKHPGGIYQSLLALMEVHRIFRSNDDYLTSNWKFGNPIPNTYTPDAPWRLFAEQHTCSIYQSDILGFLLGTTVFGAVHLAAWNFDFPTPIESFLWKNAAVLCTTTCFVFAGFCTCCIVGSRNSKSESVSNTSELESVSKPFHFIIAIIFFISCLFMVGGYVASRLFLIVEIFRSLWFLPQSAYVATWM